ncbi:MAG: hypothetical protein WA902_18845 [Thermosynechococcaceae cyanobacterium]
MATPKNMPAVDLTALDTLADGLPKTQSETAKKAQNKSKVPSRRKAPDSPLTVKIPDYVHKALKIQAATTGKTQREILLEALKLYGIDVEDDDIIDRRKS